MMYKEDYEKIIGKVITSYSLSEDKQDLVLHIKEGGLHFQAEGDCCSESWIEHITDHAAFPATIIAIEEKSLGEQSHPDHECLSLYSTIFKTDRGDLEVEYRNSSNGYYGGSLEFRGMVK